MPVSQSEEIKQAIQGFVTANGGNSEELKSIDWKSKRIHQTVIRALASVGTISDSIHGSRVSKSTYSELKKSLPDSADGIIRSTVGLEWAMNLVKRDLHDEALTILNQIEFEKLPQPSLGVIYKTICLHQLVELDQAKLFSELLLANSEHLPVRYRFMIDSIYADIMQHKAKPLSRVASLMSDAGRRQNLERQSRKVLEQEDEIIKSLEKLINDLEKQKKKMRMAADSSAQPAPAKQNSSGGDSRPSPSGPRLKGEVESRNQESDGDWGDLSKEEKAIAVKNLVRELPPHFQTLMNAYFQKLAEEKK